MRDAFTYIAAYLHWLQEPDGGGHKACKKYARQQMQIAKKQRAERNAMRGTPTSKGRTMNLISAIKRAFADWKRQRANRARRQSLTTPFD